MKHPDQWKRKVGEEYINTEPLIFNRIPSIQNIINRNRSRMLDIMTKRATKLIDKLCLDTLSYDLVRGCTATLTLGKAEEKDMKTMLFQTMKFHKGLNTTVRMGNFWSACLSIGDLFKITHPSMVDVPGSHYRYGVVESILRSRFNQENIPAYVLDNSHNPKCRSFDGLIGNMIEHYGIEEVYSTAVVTSVGFTVLEVK